jgi:hypothetical protein
MDTEHYLKRLENRVYEAFKDPIHLKDRSSISKNIALIQSDFDVSKMKSTAIRLHEFSPSERSSLYVNVNGRSYYRTYDIMGKDSTGDELWIVVRNGNIVTVMMRKGIQPLEKLRVNKFIKFDI